MPTNSRPATVNILAFPEVGVSTVYGMFDMFSSAGRDWGFIVDGKPGDSLIAPRIVAATREPFAAGNGITIHPDATFDEAGTPDVVCVPDVLVAPGQPLDGRFTDQVAYLKRCHDAGAILATSWPIRPCPTSISFTKPPVFRRWSRSRRRGRETARGRATARIRDPPPESPA